MNPRGQTVQKAALQAFLALHGLTGDEGYLEWAEQACDVVLTYVVA